MLLAFHKPFGVLSQFTPDGSKNRTLAEFGFPKDVYPLGRLDADSEGLLLLSDELEWNARLLAPGQHVEKTYFVLVEREPGQHALHLLRSGIVLDGKPTLPAKACLLDPQPEIPPRVPPVRFRKNVRDFWIEVRLVEGRNRQVRRMTAAVGHPTLRIVRTAIGDLTIDDLPAGKWRLLSGEERRIEKTVFLPAPPSG
ncbi:MAG: pseudouridine synthase [Verrucomicrobiota bacterium]